jgi:hypothetical protein
MASMLTATVSATHTAAPVRLGHALSDSTSGGTLLAPALNELLEVVLRVQPGCCSGDACTCTCP